MPPLTPALLFASVIVACWIAPTSSFVIRLQGAILGSGGSGTIWFVGLLGAGVGDTLVLRWSLVHPTQTRTTSNGKTRNMADKPISILRCLQNGNGRFASEAAVNLYAAAPGRGSHFCVLGFVSLDADNYALAVVGLVTLSHNIAAVCRGRYRVVALLRAGRVPANRQVDRLTRTDRL